MRRTSTQLVVVVALLLVAGGSAGSAPPGQSAPVNVSLPSLSGGTVEGQTLQAGPGTWSGPSVSYSYQWQRCDSSGGGCAAVAGASGTSYPLGAADRGDTLRVTVSATNKNGSTLASSAPSAVIAAATATASTTSTTTTQATTTTTAPTTTAATTTTTSTTTTAAPTSSSSGNLLRNQSAALMSTLYSTGTTSQGQSPTGFWDCLCFKNNDIQLASDPTAGAVYSVSEEPGSSNPWYPLSSNMAGAEITKRRDIRYGQWDWYAIAVKIPTTYTPSDWGLLTQFEYPSITSPPLGIALDRNGLGLNRNVGSVSPDSTGYMRAALIEQPRFLSLASIEGKWLDIVIGVKWATDNTGDVEAWTKLAGESSYTLRWSHYNTPTMQYKAGSNPPTAGLDKQGLYLGNYNTSTTAPTNHITETGITVATDRTTAQNTLP